MSRWYLTLLACIDEFAKSLNTESGVFLHNAIVVGDYPYGCIRIRGEILDLDRKIYNKVSVATHRRVLPGSHHHLIENTWAKKMRPL